MVCSASDPAVSLKAIARVAEYTYKHGLIKLRCLGKSVATLKYCKCYSYVYEIIIINQPVQQGQLASLRKT